MDSPPSTTPPPKPPPTPAPGRGRIIDPPRPIEKILDAILFVALMIGIAVMILALAVATIPPPLTR